MPIGATAGDYATFGLSAESLTPTPKAFTISRVVEGGRVHLALFVPDSLDGFAWKEIGGTLGRFSATGEFVFDCRQLQQQDIDAFVIGFSAGGYTFDRYKTKAKPTPEWTLALLVDASKLQALSDSIERSEKISDALRLARDLANTPANHLSPAGLAEASLEHLGNLGISVEIWDEVRLREESCGALLAVGQGSANPPRLVRARYGNGPVKLSLVGKGITFDTGGLSLKPADSMLGMKYDMTGAAVALGALVAIASLKLNLTVEIVLCIAENMPGPIATRPGDVVTSRSGTTIEITNTDAEGRLVLADGISVALESEPEHLVDIATLTGAATIALGTRYGGLMGTGSTPDAILKAAIEASERLWRMPLAEDARKILDSTIADIMNAKVGSRAGGMLVGGQFLAEFANRDGVRNWAHLDIANVASNDGPAYEENPNGPTAYGLRTIVRLAENLSAGR